MRVGATGRFPQGKLDKTDEGELAIGVAADHSQQIIRIEFGKPVAWIGFSKQQALQLSDLIRKNAEKLD
jgi:hypothetical protein